MVRHENIRPCFSPTSIDFLPSNFNSIVILFPFGRQQRNLLSESLDEACCHWDKSLYLYRQFTFFCLVAGSDMRGHRVHAIRCTRAEAPILHLRLPLLSLYVCLPVETILYHFSKHWTPETTVTTAIKTICDAVTDVYTSVPTSMWSLVPI